MWRRMGVDTCRWTGSGGIKHVRMRVRGCDQAFFVASNGAESADNVLLRMSVNRVLGSSSGVSPSFVIAGRRCVLSPFTAMMRCWVATH